MVTIAVSRNFGPLTAVELLTREDFAAIGRLARERIVRRTQQGRDEHDRSFVPYTPEYAAQKAALGTSAGVNLQLSGQMLNAITVEPDAKGVTLSFSS